MATQSDLDKLRKQLSDLDAKLKSMRGNSPRRNPNFDSAMANQNFKNSMAEQRARIEADRANRRMAPIPPPEQGQYTQGRLMGAPSEQQPSQWTANQDEQKFLRDKYAKIEAERGIPLESRIKAFNDLTRRPAAPAFDFTQAKGLGGLTADQAGIPADQRKILDDLMAQQQVDIAANEAKRQNFLKTQKPVGGSMAGPIYGSLAGNILANGAPANMSPDQLNAMRMQQYNQFLGQGMQNSNTLNQDAMTNFANMQAGIESTQPATATTPKPAMPVAGMGMQKSSPAPRKFLIANNPSAKAF